MKQFIYADERENDSVTAYLRSLSEFIVAMGPYLVVYKNTVERP
ncbi:hypothetical protein [Ruoffia halotolerans]|nr:hypothetical protein [Ruoffia halotolerans]